MSSDFQFHHTTLRFVRGDIAALAADALVASDDNYLTMAGGASLALLKAGGPTVRDDARKHVPLQLGDVVAVTAGALPAQYILFVVAVDFDRAVYAGEAQLREGTLRCLRLADALGAHTLAAPALATGLARLPPAQAAEALVRAIADYASGETGISEVTLVEYLDPKAADTGPGEFYTRAVAVAGELAQQRRFYAIVDELKTLTLAGPLAENLAALQQEIDTLQASLRAIRARAVALQRADQPAPTQGAAALANAPRLAGTEGIDLPALRLKLIAGLNAEDVKNICFDLNIQPDELGTTALDGMVRELMNTLMRHNQLDKLLAWLDHNRRDIAPG